MFILNQNAKLGLWSITGRNPMAVTCGHWVILALQSSVVRGHGLLEAGSCPGDEPLCGSQPGREGAVHRYSPQQLLSVSHLGGRRPVLEPVSFHCVDAGNVCGARLVLGTELEVGGLPGLVQLWILDGENVLVRELGVQTPCGGRVSS